VSLEDNPPALEVPLGGPKPLPEMLQSVGGLIPLVFNQLRPRYGASKAVGVEKPFPAGNH
jgi:hypothetical protein